MNSEELTVDGIAALLGLDGKPPRCVSPRTLHLAHKSRPNAYQVGRVGCDSWGCPGCAHRKRLRFGVHLAVRFMDSERPVCEEKVSGKGWKRRHQQLNRVGADYVKVAAGCGIWWVLHNAPDACHPFASVTGGISRLGEHLRAVQPVGSGRNCVPVSLSRRWSLPKRSGEYSLLGLLPLTKPDTLRAALEVAEVKVRERREEPGREWAVGYSLAEGQSLAIDGEKFEVRDELKQRSVWRDHSCIRTVPSSPAPLFRIEYGEAGPVLVVEPANAGEAQSRTGEVNE